MVANLVGRCFPEQGDAWLRGHRCFWARGDPGRVPSAASPPAPHHLAPPRQPGEGQQLAEHHGARPHCSEQSSFVPVSQPITGGQSPRAAPCALLPGSIQQLGLVPPWNLKGKSQEGSAGALASSREARGSGCTGHHTVSMPVQKYSFASKCSSRILHRWR